MEGVRPAIELVAERPDRRDQLITLGARARLDLIPIERSVLGGLVERFAQLRGRVLELADLGGRAAALVLERLVVRDPLVLESRPEARRGVLKLAGLGGRSAARFLERLVVLDRLLLETRAQARRGVLKLADLGSRSAARLVERRIVLDRLLLERGAQARRGVLKLADLGGRPTARLLERLVVLDPLLLERRAQARRRVLELASLVGCPVAFVLENPLALDLLLLEELTKARRGALHLANLVGRAAPLSLERLLVLVPLPLDRIPQARDGALQVPSLGGRAGLVRALRLVRLRQGALHRVAKSDDRRAEMVVVVVGGLQVAFYGRLAHQASLPLDRVGVSTRSDHRDTSNRDGPANGAKGVRACPPHRSTQSVLPPAAPSPLEQLRAAPRRRALLWTVIGRCYSRFVVHAPSEGGAGRHIARFVVQRKLGSGGMGSVYEALDPSTGRTVAVKVLHSASTAATARFVREARALARLRHPGVISVHEVGVDGGRPFLVMDLVEGRTLDELVEQGPLEPSRAATIAASVADALAAAHSTGLVHRDVKPENILIEAGGAPRLVDFGIVRDVDASSSLTNTGQFVGTPGFASPEQAAGRASEAGASSDVFSLGAVLHYCLTGQRPFDGTTPTEALFAVLRREPDPPSHLRPGVPRDLDAVVAHCLEKDPADRYESAGALALDLRRFLEGSPIERRVGELSTRQVLRGAAWEALAVGALLGAFTIVLRLIEAAGSKATFTTVSDVSFEVLFLLFRMSPALAIFSIGFAERATRTRGGLVAFMSIVASAALGSIIVAPLVMIVLTAIALGRVEPFMPLHVLPLAFPTAFAALTRRTGLGVAARMLLGGGVGFASLIGTVVAIAFFVGRPVDGHLAYGVRGALEMGLWCLPIGLLLPALGRMADRRARRRPAVS